RPRPGGVIGWSAEPMGLRPAREPRLHGLPRRIIRNEAIIGNAAGQHAERMRPWTDQRHVALEHVDELGQFVDRGPAEEAADGSNAGIIANRLHHARDVAAIDIHGAEFKYADRLAVQSLTRLAEENGPRTRKA